MRRIISLLIALFILVGCFEDKGAILAECRLKYEDKPTIDGQNIVRNVELCMRAKGYIFKDFLPPTEVEIKQFADGTRSYKEAVKLAASEENNACYYGTGDIPFFQKLECYEKVRWVWP